MSEIVLVVCAQKEKKNISGNIRGIVSAPYAMDNMIWRLATIKARRHLAMLFLAPMTAPGGLSLPRCRTATSSDAFVVCTRVI